MRQLLRLSTKCEDHLFKFISQPHGTNNSFTDMNGSHNREFKIYDATVAKTSLKIASSSFSIYSVIMSVCLTFES